MGLMDRLLHREPSVERPCPRCGIPAPPDTDECAACGWDLQTEYHGVTPGSHLQEPASPPASSDEAAK